MNLKSVCGELSREKLGIVTTHEHVLLDLTAFFQSLPVDGVDDPATEKVTMDKLGILSRDCYALKDNLLLDSEEIAIKELGYFKRAGGNTVVDASLDGIGRNPKALKRISEATGLNIIMGCGFYVGETHPEYLSKMSEREIADIMVRELTEGIDGYVQVISEKSESARFLTIRSAEFSERQLLQVLIRELQLTFI